MLSFNRIVSLFALFISFALLSHARPAGVVEARADATELIAKFTSFQSEMATLSQGLNDIAATGASPVSQVQKIVVSFNTMTTYLSKSAPTLTSKNEEEIANILSSIVIALAGAADLVAQKANHIKWYSTWMELDVCIHNLFFTMPGQCSYRTYELTLKSIGSATCTIFHQLRMRLAVNDMLGMGVGYN